MEELSIEQKAKRYDEALKVLHKYDGANIMFSQSLKEEMFPELKESEDEMVRKELLQIAKESEDSFYMVMTPNKRERLIAWLEKQGEQEPTDEEMKRLLQTEYEKGRADTIAEIQQPWSEEDEKIVLSVEQVMNCASLLNIVPEKVDKIRTWLKSLKERMKGE